MSPQSSAGYIQGRAGCAPCGTWAFTSSPWAWPMVAFGVYVFIVFGNDLLGYDLQMVGAGIFLAIMGACSCGAILPVPLCGLSVSLLLALLLPAVGKTAGFTVEDPAVATYAVKYYALLLLILATASLGLPPLHQTCERFWGLGALLALLLLGGGLAATGGGAERVEGSFANPNNFALAAIGLLCFVDPEKDSRRFVVGMYALVLALILRSGTAGALLGYLAGLAMLLPRTRRWIPVYLATLGASALVLLPGFLPAPDPEALGEARFLGPIWVKLQLFRDNYGVLVSGGDVNFWELGTAYGGTELTSALWRLFHWREILWVLGRADWTNLLFGHGLGTSAILVGKLPHNDYLRLLLEVGILGLVANAAVWIMLYRRLIPPARHVLLMVAVYSLTENNLDNFLVMSLLVLFVTSAGHPPAFPPRFQRLEWTDSSEAGP